jgi:hypothetical protein
MTKAFALLLAGIISIVLTSFTRGGDAQTMIATVYPADWKLIGTSGSPGCYASDTIRCPVITEGISDSGAVLVYIFGMGSDGWSMLPHSYNSSGMVVTSSFNYKAGYVELRTYNVYNRLERTMNTLKFKIVAIPGSVK